MTFDPRSLKPHQFINQFPYENMITCKDLLVLVAKRASDSGATLPSWLPLTFNLLYELPRLVRCYKEREERSARLRSHDCQVILCCTCFVQGVAQCVDCEAMEPGQRTRHCCH